MSTNRISPSHSSKGDPFGLLAHSRQLLIVLLGFVLLVPDIYLHGDDWPQWRGPDRSNASRDTGLLREWPPEGPSLVWRASGLGEGIASVSLAQGRLYTSGYRDGGEFVWALDAGTGQKMWARRVGPLLVESPLMRWLTQRVPTLDNDRLYTLSSQGELNCLAAADGKILWRKSYPHEFGSRQPIWGFSDRPLVDGNQLICAPAGTNATVVALDKRSGDMIWKTQLSENERAGYAATVVSEAGGIRQYVALLNNALAGIAAEDGRLLWRYPTIARTIASSYTPIVHGDLLLSANGYGRGVALLKLVRDGDGIAVQEQYYRRLPLDPFEDSTVLVGEHVYTCTINRGVRLACLEWKTAQVVWDTTNHMASGKAALTYADGSLYVRRSSGLMTLVEATPVGYHEKGSFEIPDHAESIGATFPVVAGRRLFLRDNDHLFCYDLAAGEATQTSLPPPKRTVLALSDEEINPTGPGNAKFTEPGQGRFRGPDALYVPTPEDVVERMLELAEVKPGDLVYDLGSGDGRIVIAAAKKYGCRAVGYEIDPRLVKQAEDRVKRQGLEHLVRIEHADMFPLDLSAADVIAVYLPEPLLQRLLPQFEKLRPGARIVSHQFVIPHRAPDKVVSVNSSDDGERHRLTLWKSPLRAQDPQGNESTPR